MNKNVEKKKKEENLTIEKKIIIKVDGYCHFLLLMRSFLYLFTGVKKMVK